MAAPSRPMATLRSGNGLSSNPDLEELDDAEAGDSVAEMSVRDMRTAVQRGKLGVAIAAGSHTQVTAEESIAHGANRTGPQRGKKKQSLAEASLGAIRKGDLKALGGHAVQAVRRPLRALAGGKDGQAANNLRGQTFNLDDLDPDADGDGVVSAFEKAVYERIRRIDKDGDGKLSIHELYDVVEEAVAAKQARAKDKASRAHSSQRCARLHPHPTHCALRAIYAARTCTTYVRIRTVHVYARAARHTTRLAGQAILQDALPRHCRRRGRPAPLPDAHHGRPHVRLQRHVHQPRRGHDAHRLGQGRHVRQCKVPAAALHGPGAPAR